MREAWQLYASDNIDGKLRRLWVSPMNQYRVIHGNDIKYQGSQMTRAIAAWEAVEDGR